MKRIVITGSECTGKTTLAAALASWLGVPWLAEASREVATALARPLTADDVGTIATRHMTAVDRLARERHPLLVLDTDLVSTVTYARHYYGDAPSWIAEEALARRGDLYLLAHPDIPWVPDEVRDRPGPARAILHQAFVAQLAAIGATVIPIDGLGPARMARAMAAVRGWRAARSD